MTGTGHGSCAYEDWPQAKNPVAVKTRYVIMIGRRNSGSKVPPFLMDILRTKPSINGPEMRVANSEAAKAERLVRPTPLIEKLYGGAEKICESVMEIPTSHDTQVVKSRVAQSTAGERRSRNGRKIVLKKEMWLTYPLYGRRLV